MKKILIAEDDKFLHNILSAKLQKSGFEVVSAYDGEQAVAAIKKELPDLVLLDLIMPKKNGFEVLSDIKIDPKLAKIPIIVLSNLGQESDQTRAKEFKVADYMVKVNFSLEEVVAKIKEHLAKK